MRFIDSSVYDYKALYSHLASLERPKPTPLSDEEMVRAAGRLSNLEFEIFKFCRTADRFMGSSDVVDYLVRSEISVNSTEGVVKSLWMRIRKKGFKIDVAPNHRPRREGDILRAVKMLSDGLSHGEIKERVSFETTSLKVLLVKLRKKYPQFFRGYVANR